MQLCGHAKKFSQYLVGLPSFQLETDHKPLVPILMTKDLQRTPLRCQRMLMRMMRFNAKVIHRTDKELLIAKALSRFPTEEQDSQIQEVLDSYIENLEENASVTLDRLNEIRAATLNASDLQQVISYVLHRWPVKVPEHLSQKRPTHCEQQKRCPRIPKRGGNKYTASKSPRHKRRRMAQNAVWWPGLGSELKNLVNNCKLCQENRPEQKKEPVKVKTL